MKNLRNIVNVAISIILIAFIVNSLVQITLHFLQSSATP